MLNDASGFRRIYLATGYTDLRRGMEGLASIIKFNFQLDPYQKDILFLFCGRRTDRIKGWSGKATASCFYTKDWSWVHSTGPAQKKKHWRSPQSSTNISCRDWKLLHAIRSRKSDRIRSYKILCKTEKIKKHLPIIISPEKELSTFHNSAAFIYSGVLSGPFTGLVDKYSEKPEKLIVF